MKIRDRYEYDPAKDLLGKGGFARVFRARDTLLNRDVALKVFSQVERDQYSVLAEIRKAIQLEHPNLLRYYDVVLLEQSNALGEAEQLQIGVMEYANAGDLKAFARANPGSPLLPKFLREVLYGLEYLHAHGIIHRDLKAQNILLLKRNGQLTAKISDFGISKDLTSEDTASSTMLVGTIEYMAPEQFNPKKFGIDGKVQSNVDLWGYGVMVHELLTDVTPFGKRGADTTAEQIMSAILSPELPGEIELLAEPYRSVVKRCLVANAKDRIQKASELLGYFGEPGYESFTPSNLVAPDEQPAVPDDGLTKVFSRSEPDTGAKPAKAKVGKPAETDDAARSNGKADTTAIEARDDEAGLTAMFPASEPLSPDIDDARSEAVDDEIPSIAVVSIDLDAAPIVDEAEPSQPAAFSEPTAGNTNADDAGEFSDAEAIELVDAESWPRRVKLAMIAVVSVLLVFAAYQGLKKGGGEVLPASASAAASDDAEAVPPAVVRGSNKAVVKPPSKAKDAEPAKPQGAVCKEVCSEQPGQPAYKERTFTVAAGDLGFPKGGAVPQAQARNQAAQACGSGSLVSFDAPLDGQCGENMCFAKVTATCRAREATASKPVRICKQVCG